MARDITRNPFQDNERERALRIELSNTMGLRLVTGPFALFGFESGTRIPAPMIADKLLPRATAELIMLATALASSSGLYLSNSLGMLSGPHAFPLDIRWKAVETSKSVIGLMNV